VKYDQIDTLHTFGEMAIVEHHPTCCMRSMLQDHGQPAMFVCITHEHTCDTYCFLSVISNRILMSRDVVWTGTSYGEYCNINPPQLPALPTRILLDKPTDVPMEALEVTVPPGISDVVDKGNLVDSFSDEAEEDFLAEKKVLTKLKKFISTILPTPTVKTPVVPNGTEPGRALTPVELVNILFPMPTVEAFGYLFVVDAVDDVVIAYDNIEPIKY
jgi:hypothetical protein